MMSSELRYLARSYFHQDYDLESGTPSQVVESFRRDESDAKVDALRHEIERVLAAGMSEDMLAVLWIDQAGASCDPRDDGMEISRWFETVVEALA
ncbi:contact-dependent growth inhibition system immunity protein [Streptomyces sp. NPDC048659]|uniref:contact-dependent growth inhibition system immunity protein n=1 Tax=Streptomyces sp. NPDC048659 TaxID=3155489 RepID=UPI0034176615